MRKLTAPALWLSVDLALIAAGTSAQAHALLDHASPGVGSSIATAPPVLSLSVTNEAGQRVDLGNAQVPPGTPTELRVGLPPLPPGTHTVSWRVVSVDTHPTEGHFQFTIGR